MSEIIKASPTKSFFINMITRDIELKMAILDLVDNSIDSAYLKADNENLEDIEINLTFDKESFTIEDNCNGFDIETAKKYVFRFGSDNKTLDESTIGQFGIGMKRSIFKLGNSFCVESFTNTTHLVVKDNIKEWSKKQKTSINEEGIRFYEDDWSFTFTTADYREADSKSGTKLIITDLYDPIKKNIINGDFITQLKNEIEIAHMLSLNNKLRINIKYFDEVEDENKNIRLKSKELKLLNNEFITPINTEVKIKVDEENEINAHIYLGVTKRILEESGFYIFCNKRTIVHANKDAVIWSRDKIGLNWHHNYALFRGYIFLEAEKTSLLPWTTTKDGIDVDSIVFQKLIKKLSVISAPIFEFLRKGAKERDEKKLGRYLNSPIYTKIDASEANDYLDINTSSSFVSSIQEAEKNEKYETSQRIQYNKEVSKIMKLQKFYEVTSNYEVGQKTFDFCYKKFIEGR